MRFLSMTPLACGLALPASAQEPTWSEIDHPAGPAAPAKANFGAATAVLDFLGDGVADVAVGAPGESAVYLFFGRFDFEVSVRITVPEPQSGDRFGSSLAAAALDGVPGDELVVGAPHREVSGDEVAGAVYVFGRRFFSSPVELGALSPESGARLGSSVEAADLDGDGVIEIAAGAPRGTDGSGTTSGRVHVFEWSTGEVTAFTNHASTSIGNFGHDLAATDFDGDGHMDLVVSALGNDADDGRPVAGQVVCLLGPLDVTPHPAAATLVLEDPNTVVEAQPNQRWGMSIDARGGMLVVGSPRRDVGATVDAGQGTVFTHAAPALQHVAPDPMEGGLLGFRARAIDLVGDGSPDVVFVGLVSRTTHVWDADDPGTTISLPAPPDASDHWAEGMSSGQIVPGGREEVVFGSPRWEPSGKGKNFDSGRVMVMTLD